MSLPLFPDFKPLELSDKSVIESFTSKYGISSDYYFLSLWCWDIYGHAQVSELNNNLVIKFNDYITHEPFYTFLGDQKINETATTLVKKAKDEGICEELKLILQVVVNNLINSKEWNISEDPDNFDYLLSTEKLSSMKDAALYTKLKELRKFNELYSSRLETKIVTIKDEVIKNQILQFFEDWRILKNKSAEETNNELKAVSRLVSNTDFFDSVEVLYVTIDQKMVGFLVFEKLPELKITMNTFKKSDTNFRGINEFINHSVASHLFSNGYNYMNVYQDLGIPGLRQSKRAYAPEYLKKYILSLRSEAD